MTTEEGNEIIATWLGWKKYLKCKTSTWFYECEYYKWEELDEHDKWVLEPTEEFDKTPCTSEMYWEYERDMKKQWKDYNSYLTYDSSWNELIPVVKKILKAIPKTITSQYKKYEGSDIHNTQAYPPGVYKLQEKSRMVNKAIQKLEIEPLWQYTVEAIQLINKYRTQ